MLRHCYDPIKTPLFSLWQFALPVAHLPGVYSASQEARPSLLRASQRITAMSEVTVATLNLFNRMSGWDARAPLVLDQWERLSPDIIALQEVSLLTDQGTWLCREVNERRAGRDQYRIKHAAHPDKAPAAAGLGVASLLDPKSHEILDLMSFESIAQRLVFEVEGRRFAFAGTHLHYPVDASGARVRQIEYLLAWLDSRADGLPLILTGDFNAYADPPEKTVQILKSRFRSAYERSTGASPIRPGRRPSTIGTSHPQARWTTSTSPPSGRSSTPASASTSPRPPTRPCTPPTTSASTRAWRYEQTPVTALPARTRCTLLLTLPAVRVGYVTHPLNTASPGCTGAPIRRHLSSG